MHTPVVSGEPVVSKIVLVGPAPSEPEPALGQPFAWAAGQTLFKWLFETSGLTEDRLRSSIYVTAVCRCFPGKKPGGGDLAPSPEDAANCSVWLKRELTILKPELVIPVGKLAISWFLPTDQLDDVIGNRFRIWDFDVIPLPQPSAASLWRSLEPGKTLLHRALTMIASHPAFLELR
jgi:uracil-DNA glycosylase